MGSDMRFDGIGEMINNIRALGISTDRAENKAVRSGGEELRESMSHHAPGPSNKKREVHLPDNIQMGRVKKDERGKLVEVGPGRGSFYSYFLEFGTSKMSPYPFIGPSIDESKERVLKIMADELRDGIKIP
ncbi:HK97-gp10 family putative phage morphogenesis protein [Thermoactinomyces sp. DSM 45892]|uniref:HK97-gp10 family putative phage morphogenesis protein n=1 Tax=Thermoactinomyces sp. DSM 45892 TaxID=1882753 RepID=UPI00089542B7|nr:HK97-gp10 family putative phage morphogenesis protein [Thermoactinomyces sp. DSM 45892]SDY84697.1 phage protein, HK97 gp10 family [Thermoactinomyces sp. DSM 45892]